MNGVYKSLKGKVQDTFQAGKASSTPAPIDKSTELSLHDELADFEKAIVERVSRLKAALNQGEASKAGEARQAQQTVGELKATIATLEGKLKETAETIRKKDSSRQQIEETLKARIQELLNEAKKKEDLLAARNKESADLRTSLDTKSKQFADLESVSDKLKQEVAGHAKRADETAAASRAKIETLELQLKQREELARQKESLIKELEQKLAAKIVDFENFAKEKQKILSARDAMVSDLKSQLKLLTKGIGEMSSFFKQAQAFTIFERQDSGPAAPLNGRGESSIPSSSANKLAAAADLKAPVGRPNPLAGEPLVPEQNAAKPQSAAVTPAPAVPRQKETAAQSGAGRVSADEQKAAAAKTGSVAAAGSAPAAECLPIEAFERLSDELAEVAGVMNPLAALIVREHVEGLGESTERFPRARLPELLDSLSRELLDEKRQTDFRKRLVRNSRADL
jgi:hypothetical protein